VTINDVTCGSPTYCVAVGSYRDTDRRQEPLLLTQTSGVWAEQPITLPSNALAGPSGSPSDVSCASDVLCAAVGTYDVSGGPEGLVVDPSGAQWESGEAPLPGPFTYVGQIGGVSCTTDGSCTAVDAYGDEGSRSYEQYLSILTDSGGTWSVRAGPTPANSGPFTIDGLSCASADSCAAVGFFYNSAQRQRALLLSERAGVWYAWRRSCRRR
jgi:hypothetical protein